MSRKRQEEGIRQNEAQQSFLRESRRLEAELSQQIRRQDDSSQREHLEALRHMGVELTAYLTQARADQVIEFRGNSQPHVHLDKLPGKVEDGKVNPS